MDSKKILESSIGEKQFSTDFKKFFLLQFTKELIKHSITKELIKLEEAVKKEEKEKKQEIKRQLKKLEGIKTENLDSEEWESSILGKKLPTLTKHKIGNGKSPTQHQFVKRFKPLPIPQRQIPLKPFPGPLRIPEVRFPQRLQYLRPIPTNLDIDLIKLNPLVRDPKVKIIECHGPDQNLIVKGDMGTKKTKIILDKEEIDEVIQIFSKATKIPAQEGVYKVVIGKIILSAIISDVIGAKFIIKKMSPYSSRFRSPGFGAPIYRGRF